MACRWTIELQDSDACVSFLFLVNLLGKEKCLGSWRKLVQIFESAESS